MTSPRVILITASGPGGNQVDVGVRSDATPAELVMSLGNVLGVGLGGTLAEHHAPPRPGVPRGVRARLDVDRPLVESGVADGDMIIFANRSAAATMPRPPMARPTGPPGPPGMHGPAGGANWAGARPDQGAGSHEPPSRR